MVSTYAVTVTSKYKYYEAKSIVKNAYWYLPEQVEKAKELINNYKKGTRG